MASFILRQITAANMADVAFLVQEVAQKRFPVDYYLKKYNAPGANGQYQGWLAYDPGTGKPVSVAAALPFFAQLPDGQEIKITQLIETFTLKNYQGRGLMTLLVNKIIDEHKKNGTRMFFGLTNQNNVYGFVNKLGFTHTGNMQFFKIRIRTFPLEALCRRCGIPGAFRWWAGSVLARFVVKNANFPNSAIQEGHWGVLHDDRFFAYKSFSFNKICRFSGITAWLKLETGLLVGDVAIPENCAAQTFEDWISTLQTIARRAGLRQIVFQSHPDSRLAQYLSTRFEPHPSWSVCCLAADAAMEAHIPGMRFCYGDFDTF